MFLTGVGAAADRESLPAPPPVTLQSLDGPVHLGDEELPDWPRLFGNCLELDFQMTPPLENVSFILQTRGLAINAPVYLNYRRIAVLPRQTGLPHTPDRPGEWSKDLLVTLPAANLCHGLNRITITTDLVANQKFSGDLADFQIRKLRLISKERADRETAGEEQ